MSPTKSSRQWIFRSLTYPSMSPRRNTAKTLENVSSHEVCFLADTLTATTTQPERKRNNFKMLVVDDDKKTTFSFNTEKHIFPIDFLYAVQPVKNKNKKRRTVEEKGQCPVWWGSLHRVCWCVSVRVKKKIPSFCVPFPTKNMLSKGWTCFHHSPTPRSTSHLTLVQAALLCRLHNNIESFRRRFD